MSTTTNDQVRDAAEALVAVLKAVSGKVESTSSQQQQSMNDVTEALKKSVDTLHQTVEASKMAMDRKLETMHQNIEGMKDTNDKMVMTIDTLNGHLATIEAHFKEQAKRQRLQDLESLWKEGNVTSYSFRYNAWSAKNARAKYENSSSLFFNEMLPRFLLGHEYNIPPNFSAKDYFRAPQMEITEEDKALFRTKLSDYVEKMTGYKPRLVDNGDGTHTMYFS